MNVEFSPDAFYRPNDEALRVIGTPGTLAQWRSREIGPPFLRLHKGTGARVLYVGEDLIKWLKDKRITPA